MAKAATVSQLLVSLMCTSCMLICLAATPAFSQTTVTWVKNDFIPFYIQEGSFKNQGISDRLIQFFIKHLPDYTHRTLEMPMERFYLQAQNNNLVCNPLLLKTPEREVFLTYSNKMKPAYAHVLVSIHPIDYPKEGLSLREFLQNDDHTLIVQSKRSYGPHLDQIIKKATLLGRIEPKHYATAQLFKMIEYKRDIYFLDIENSVTYYRETHKNHDDLFYIPIQEDQLDRFGYVACTRNALGQTLIEKINNILKREAASPELRSILELWMAPANLPRLRHFYDRTILGK
jgi:uncharacterized protein (TIGR02285 family)